MYAVVQTGGKQYKLSVGQTVLVDLLDAAKAAGDKVELDQVLMIGQDDTTRIGQPTVPGAVVRATVVEPEFKGQKLVVFKYKSKVRYRKKTGHRQRYAKLVVDEIVTGDGAAATAVAATQEA